MFALHKQTFFTVSEIRLIYHKLLGILLADKKLINMTKDYEIRRSHILSIWCSMVNDFKAYRKKFLNYKNSCEIKGNQPWE